MSVIHIMKDGSVVMDITDRVVRIEDAGSLYKLITDISRNGSEKKSNQLQD